MSALIDAGDLCLNVEQCGSGSSVLLLHGFTGSLETMGTLASALSDSFQVLSVDLPGHGKTRFKSGLGSLTMLDCARSIVALLDKLNIQRTHLLGYSMGGRLALTLAACFPTRISSLVTIGACPGLEDPQLRLRRSWDDESLARLLEEQGMEVFVDHWMALPLFESQQKLGPAFIQAAKLQRMKNNPAGLASSLRGMGLGAQIPLTQELKAANLPMLLVAGEQDPKFCYIAASLSEHCEKASVAIISGAGHAAHLEAFEDTLEQVREFLHLFDKGSPHKLSQ